jgi:uncharacterized protein (UPF0261 family)
MSFQREVDMIGLARRMGGTLDTKGREHAFVAKRIRDRGHAVLLIDVGTGGPPAIEPDIPRADVAAAAGLDLAAVRARGDRGECVTAMTAAAPRLLERLVADGRIQGVIALGGGTAIASAAPRQPHRAGLLEGKTLT